MKPRRLHSDTIFSMRAGSVTSLLAIVEKVGGEGKQAAALAARQD
jgi:hypothetical protein